MLAAHLRLKGCGIERFGFAALQAFPDGSLKLLDRMGAFLVTPDQKSNVITGIAEAAPSGALFDSDFHGIGN